MQRVTNLNLLNIQVLPGKASWNISLHKPFLSAKRSCIAGREIYALMLAFGQLIACCIQYLEMVSMVAIYADLRCLLAARVVDVLVLHRK